MTDLFALRGGAASPVLMSTCSSFHWLGLLHASSFLTLSKLALLLL